MSSLEKGRNTPSETALTQQLALQILQHDVQCGDTTLGGVPHGGVSQIDDVAVLVGISSHHQLVFHDLLGQLCPVGADGGVTVQNEDIVGCLLHNELKRCLVAMGGGVDVGIHANILKADFASNHGAAAVVAQHIEAAAGDQSHDGGLAGGKFGQGGDPGVKIGHQLIHLALQTKHGGNGGSVLPHAFHDPKLGIGGQVDHGSNLAEGVVAGGQAAADKDD